MSAPDLHALPYGSIVAAGQVAVVRFLDGPTPWTITGSQAQYTVGDLLGISQDWAVLRHGTGENMRRDPRWQDGYATGFADLDNLSDKCPDCGCDPSIGSDCPGDEKVCGKCRGSRVDLWDGGNCKRCQGTGRQR